MWPPTNGRPNSSWWRGEALIGSCRRGRVPRRPHKFSYFNKSLAELGFEDTSHSKFLKLIVKVQNRNTRTFVMMLKLIEILGRTLKRGTKIGTWYTMGECDGG